MLIFLWHRCSKHCHKQATYHLMSLNTVGKRCKESALVSSWRHGVEVLNMAWKELVHATAPWSWNWNGAEHEAYCSQQVPQYFKKSKHFPKVSFSAIINKPVWNAKSQPNSIKICILQNSQKSHLYIRFWEALVLESPILMYPLQENALSQQSPRALLRTQQHRAEFFVSKDDVPLNAFSSQVNLCRPLLQWICLLNSSD